MKKSNYRYSRY